MARAGHVAGPPPASVAPSWNVIVVGAISTALRGATPIRTPKGIVSWGGVTDGSVGAMITVAW